MSKTFKSGRKAPSRSTIKSYSPFPSGGEFYLRDRSGECYKATLSDGNFTWVEIDPEQFPAANQGKRAA